MKRLFLLILLISLSLPSIAQETPSVTTYFLIRHAEKDRSDTGNRNPHLNDQGKKRALRWSQIFKDIKLDAVYTTNYNRTIETANPTAASQHLKAIVYNPRKPDYKDFMSKTEGMKVLIVGHSNTTPSFANALLGKDKYKQISDNNNANLYIVTKVNGVVTAVQLFIK